MGLLSQIAELDRARAAHDDKFVKSLLYYFELQVPPSAAPGPPIPYIYPLILPPESLRMNEPFTVDRAYTNGGGLFVEEQGIVAREITISGNTGWAPKRQKQPVSNFSTISFPKHRTFTRDTTKTSSQLLALSGQRHFQFLQDTVFRTYGDLKQDPATSEGTKLFFHNIKDDEHWQVIPLNFSMERDTAQPLLYRYTIQLLAVQASTVEEVRFSEDKPVFSTLRDTFLVLRTGEQLIRAALTDLGSVEGELRAINGKFVSLLDGAQGIADATADLLDGAATLIAEPFSLVENTVKAGLDALLELNTGIEDNTAVGPPANLLNSIRKAIDAVVMIGSYPSQFRNSIQTAVDKFQQRQALATSRNSDTLEAAATTVLQNIRDFANVGSGLMPGDLLRSRFDLGLGRNVPKFTSAIEYIIEMGDTLASLAARYLNDARNWRYIAIFNGLRPPFISYEGLPGTLNVGDKILIPSFSTPITVQSSPATFGVKSDEPADVQALGRDVQMVPIDREQFDLAIDVEGGSIDVVEVAGVANLKQAMRTRIITERGTDLLYKALGTSRIVGLGLTEVDFETAQFRLVDSIQSDPRIAGVRGITFTSDQPDSIVADVTAEVRGFARPELITVAAPT